MCWYGISPIDHVGILRINVAAPLLYFSFREFLRSLRSPLRSLSGEPLRSLFIDIFIYTPYPPRSTFVNGYSVKSVSAALRHSLCGS